MLYFLSNFLLQLKLKKYGKSLKDFSTLPKYTIQTIELFQNISTHSSLLAQELEYDATKLLDEYENNYRKLNQDQKKVIIYMFIFLT